MDKIEQMREALRAHIEAGVTQTVVARQAGASSAAISQFLAGKYPGDNEALAERIRQYLELVEKRRSSVAGPKFVETASARSVLMCSAFAHEYRDIALIYGESGTGKTAALMHYRDSHRSVQYVLLDPESGRPRALVGRLLWAERKRRLGQSEPLGSGVEELVGALAGTDRLIILDEAQHLAFRSMELLRRLHDEAGVGLVLAGHTMLFDRMFGSGASVYAQTFSRVGIRRHLTGDVTPDDVRKIADSMVGKVGPSALKALHQVAQQPGAFRAVVKCLRLAMVDARKESEELEAKHVEWAASYLMGVEV
jgi:DNA transposition AAA+ family ATPase